ncbi:MAG: AraC family transcriptional regulator [Lachnospiraceae bacterium]|nr:AraC family transcriptional regulator [Lachnospiraceae bacterium]
MIKTELFETMIAAYRNYGANVAPIWDTEHEIEKIDLGFRRKMTADFNYRLFASDLLKNLEEGIVYQCEDDLCLNYSFFPIPSRLQEDLHCRLLSIGPFLFRPVVEDSFEAFMEKKGIDPLYRQDFLEFFNRLPLISSMDSWNHMLGFFLEQLCEQAPEFQRINLMAGYQIPLSQAAIDYSSPSQPDVALQTIADRYSHENKIMEAVAAGNAAEAYRAYHKFQQYRLLPRVADPIRNQKNLMFTFNTLLRKAAELGHVHPMHIDTLSRQIAIQIEACLTLKQLDSLNGTMIRKYCMLVNNYSRRSYSTLIRKCLDYIDFHYNTELSLISLAKMFSVSESYLSTLFKKETGTTLTDFINSTRIRQALILLNTTSLPVGEVAARCGFLDSNYFSRIFKKQLGLSPREYRASIWKKA